VGEALGGGPAEHTRETNAVYMGFEQLRELHQNHSVRKTKEKTPLCGWSLPLPPHGILHAFFRRAGRIF
jgi:hypothetical protein